MNKSYVSYQINDDLESIATEKNIISGKRFFHNGSVLSFNQNEDSYSCKVAAEKLYLVELVVGSEGVEGSCSCGSDLICSHLIAGYLRFKQFANVLPEKKQKELALDDFFKNKFDFISVQDSIQPEIEINLDISGINSKGGSFRLSLFLNSGEGQFLDDPVEFIKNWSNKMEYRISDELNFSPERWVFSSELIGLFLFLENLIDSGRFQKTGRYLAIPNERFAGFLALCKGNKLVVSEGQSRRRLFVEDGIFGLQYTVEDSIHGNFRVIFNFSNGLLKHPADEVSLLPTFPIYGRLNNHFFEVEPTVVVGLERGFQQKNILPHILDIKKDDATFFLDKIVPFLEIRGELNYIKKMKNAIRSRKVLSKPILRFDMNGLSIRLEVLFRYGSKKVNWNEQSGLVQTGEYSWYRRNLELERDVLDEITTIGFRLESDGQLILEDENKIFDLIYKILPTKQKEWDIYHSIKFKKVVKKNDQPKIGISLSKKYDFMELTIFSGNNDFNIDPSLVLQAVKDNRNFVRLPDGEFLPLSDEQMAVLAKIGEKVNFFPSGEDSTVLRADPAFAPLIKEIIDAEGIDEEQFAVQNDLQRYSSNLVDWDGGLKIPAGLNAKLRSYQEDGFSWLFNIYNNKLGGILADDMGLGKSIQTITLILEAVKNGEKRPFLIVAPSSLVFNWANEIKKFAPGISYFTADVSPEKRQKAYEDLSSYHLIIISYSLLQKDQPFLETVYFSAIFLDEAQHIKNPGSGRTKSAKAIKADSRFALTGTPIENSLGELWSLFDFILPSYMYTYARFKREVEKPIMEEASEEVLDELKRRAAPFMLRRVKSDVLKQLPKKTEQLIKVPMYDKQKEAYLTVLSFFDKSLMPMIERDGVEKHQIELLSALTKMRQICNHPGLAIDKYRDEKSGKLDLLFELLEQCRDGNHRVLIFSQFTSMLNLIENRMDDKGFSLVRLDGSTNVNKRGGLVDKFNNDSSINAFLISLKAGGTGLNLTTADTVIHIDPWWNPAAEDQASARAYRMGQKNKVSVYRLIAENTVEEKINELQKEKKKLFEAVLGGEKIAVNKFSFEQIKELFSFDD